MNRTKELYESFKTKVLDEQWSIEGWIHEYSVTANELDNTLGLANAAMDFFQSIALSRSIFK